MLEVKVSWVEFGGNENVPPFPFLSFLSLIHPSGTDREEGKMRPESRSPD